MTTSTAFAAGSVIEVRDEEWVVSSCELAGDGWKVRCVGSSELVRSMSATFYSTLDEIEALDPAEAELVQDDSPHFRRSRLWVEAVLRKTPVPLHEPGLTVSQHMLLDPLDFQRQAVAQALDSARLRPRLLIADAVGLGKTLEIGMILSELTRRGRADRVLVVTPRHVLEQMQYELWTRFGLPLVRLDTDGIQRVRQQLPASRNPFTFFPKVIISIDTLKSARYRAHLEKYRWDAVVVDESHNLTNSGTHNNQLAGARAQHRGAHPRVRDPAQRQHRVLRRADQPARPHGDR
ncbi:MAG: SNF2-related protein [Pseudonocardiaceae bacterium]